MGFIPGWETKDNTIRDFNVVLGVKMHKIPTLFLSTDAEKAFDRVNWEMIWAVLRCLGLDNNMKKWIEAIYSSPTGRVRVNGQLSDYFSLNNGTRQGCPFPSWSLLSLWNHFYFMYEGNQLARVYSPKGVPI